MANVTVWTSRTRARAAPRSMMGVDPRVISAAVPNVSRVRGLGRRPRAIVNSGCAEVMTERGLAFSATAGTEYFDLMGFSPLELKRPGTGVSFLALANITAVNNWGGLFGTSSSGNTHKVKVQRNSSGAILDIFFVGSANHTIRDTSLTPNFYSQIVGQGWHWWGISVTDSEVRHSVSGESGTRATATTLLSNFSAALTSTMRFFLPDGGAYWSKGQCAAFFILDEALTVSELEHLTTNGQWGLLHKKRTHLLPGPNSGLTGPNSPAVWTSRTREQRALDRRRHLRARSTSGLWTDSGTGGVSATKTIVPQWSMVFRFWQESAPTSSNACAVNWATTSFDCGFLHNHANASFRNAFFWRNTAGTYYTAQTGTLPTDRWVSLCLVHKGAGDVMQTYVDGERVSQTTTAGSQATGTATMKVLNLVSGGQPVSENVADFSFIPRALLPIECERYASGLPALSLVDASDHLPLDIGNPEYNTLGPNWATSGTVAAAAGPYRYRWPPKRTYFIPSGKSASPVVTWRG